eukprot:Blabericola_migrator_1__9561@NODE_5209_length_845_cov_41_453728_g3322_i0_p1_GENE_NODE_5209_length_845_cov_41_453728_g3322_i0NODE_5209_length_845_cov_41_453728_g3322_i0_p1_ORF_typecomplete_len114_score6_32_NODE_5209_length_845_cov_41_453728_g3322_i0262603
MNFLTSKDPAPVPSSPVLGDEDERVRSQTKQLLEHRVSSLSAISGSILGTDYLREHLAQQYKKLHHDRGHNRQEWCSSSIFGYGRSLFHFLFESLLVEFTSYLLFLIVMFCSV